MGIYLLFFSGSTPEYAAVNEIVSLGRDRYRGFLNGLLRNAGRRREPLLRAIGEIPDPEIQYSMPALVIDRLKRISDRPDDDLAYLNREPVFHLRANTDRISHPELKALLASIPVEVREISQPRCFQVRNPGKILKPVLEKGLGYLQNTGSQLVSAVAAEFSRERVLDCCAAPGTKTMTLQLLRPSLHLVANDISRKRMRVLARHHLLCGLSKKNLLVSDIGRPALKDCFDLVLVDAPCSASGTLRKNPDLKRKISERSVARQAGIQAAILESAIRSFSRARFLYAVCSFFYEETEGLMEKITGRLPAGREMIPVDLSGLEAMRPYTLRRDKWGITLMPDATLNNDLFYLALFEIRSRS